MVKVMERRSESNYFAQFPKVLYRWQIILPCVAAVASPLCSLYLILLGRTFLFLLFLCKDRWGTLSFPYRNQLISNLNSTWNLNPPLPGSVHIGSRHQDVTIFGRPLFHLLQKDEEIQGSKFSTAVSMNWQWVTFSGGSSEHFTHTTVISYSSSFWLAPKGAGTVCHHYTRYYEMFWVLKWTLCVLNQ